MKNSKFLKQFFLGIFLCLFMVQTASALTFKFTYTTDVTWTEEQKATLEAAGKFLSRYISDAQEVSITIAAHIYSTETASTEWVNNVKPFTKTGKITFNKSSSISMQKAIRSLLKCLGVFTSDKFKGLTEKKPYFKTQRSFFKGPKTLALNNNNSIPLESDGLSVIQGFRDPLGVSSLNDWNPGSHILSALDLTMLADIGYTIPILTGKTTAFYFNFNLDKNFGETWRGYGELSGLGGNDTLFAGPANNKWVLQGLSGNDVLVTGDVPTEMYGDDLPLSLLPESNGTDIYYIKTAKEHVIYGLDSLDKIYINPTLNITAAQIQAATLVDANERKDWVGKIHFKYKLTLGTLSLLFWEESVDQLSGSFNSKAAFDTALANAKTSTNTKLLARIKKNTSVQKPTGNNSF